LKQLEGRLREWWHKIFYFFRIFLHLVLTFANAQSNIKSRRNRNRFRLLFFFALRAKTDEMGGGQMKKFAYLTFEERREIERMHNAGARTIDIAARLGRSATAVYQELQRGYTAERNENKQRKYSADVGQMVFQDNIARRGQRIRDRQARGSDAV